MIPKVNPPAHWEQPDPAEIEIDDSCALMTDDTFKRLPRYSFDRMPTQAGIMWKEIFSSKEPWLLYWFGENEGGYITVNQRVILVA